MRISIRSFICLARLLLLAALARPGNAQTGAGVVRGTVVDSLTARALAGAIVQIARESNPAPLRTDTTDAAGRFQFNDVSPGRYVIGFSHPALDSLGIDIADRSLTLTGGASPEVLLAIPSGRTLVTSLCGASVDTDSTGLFIGRVLHTGDMPIRAGGWPQRSLHMRTRRMACIVIATGRNCGRVGTRALVFPLGFEHARRDQDAVYFQRP